MVAWASQAQRLGFRAAKLEATFSGPYSHAGLHEPYDRVTQVIQAVRLIDCERPRCCSPEFRDVRAAA